MTALAAILAGAPAAAQTGEVRLPRERPAGNVAAMPAPSGPAAEADTQLPSAASADTFPADASPAEAESGSAVIRAVARLPRARPQPGPDLAYIDPEAATPPDLAIAVAIGSEGAACLARLRSMGVEFTEEEPIGAGGCGVPNPLSVSSLGGGIALTPAAIMNCRTTEALALWARDVMLPAARRQLDAVPNRIVHASAYVCRPRNNQAGAKLSEHARANAVDIASIDFADREPLDIRARGPSAVDGQFQSAIRKGSCRYFTTVLGPGSDAAHATHLHFDMAERRGGYRLCD